MATRRLPAAERRRQIAETALRILGERGVRGLTAAELARAVGVTDATLFRHFPSMEAIVDAAIAIVEVKLEPELTPGADEPLDQLAVFFANRSEGWHAQPKLLRLLTSDRLVDAAGKAGARRVRALRQRSESFVFDCLRRAQREGLIGSDLSPRVLTWMLRGAIHGVALSGVSPVAANRRRRSPADSPTPSEIWSTVRTVLERSAVRASAHRR